MAGSSRDRLRRAGIDFRVWLVYTLRMAATVPKMIKWDPDDLAAVDRVRGKTPLGTWIKATCRSAVAAHDGVREPKQRTQPLTPEIAAFESDSVVEVRPWGGAGRKPPHPKRAKR